MSQTVHVTQAIRRIGQTAPGAGRAPSLVSSTEPPALPGARSHAG